MANLNSWTVDRKIPLFLIVIVVLNLGGMLWFAATLQGRVDNSDRWIEHNRSMPQVVQSNRNWIERNQQTVADIPRLEERLDNIRKILDRIERRLDAIQRKNLIGGQ